MVVGVGVRNSSMILVTMWPCAYIQAGVLAFVCWFWPCTQSHVMEMCECAGHVASRNMRKLGFAQRPSNAECEVPLVDDEEGSHGQDLESASPPGNGARTFAPLVVWA